MVGPYINTAIKIFIHIPGEKQTEKAMLCRGLREFVNLLVAPLEKVQERWNLPGFYEIRGNVSDMEWYQATETITDSHYSIVGEIVEAQPKSKLKLKASLCVEPWHPRKRIKTILLEVSKQLWQKNSANIDTILQHTTNACFELGTTYSCIDSLPLGIFGNDIYTCGYRCFCREARYIDVEDKLSGVFWWQLFSVRRIKESGEPTEILRQAEFLKTQFFPKEEMISIQLSKKVSDFAMEKRAAFRELFADSLYSFSLDEIRKMSMFFVNTIFFPLNDQEKNRLFESDSELKDLYDLIARRYKL